MQGGSKQFFVLWLWKKKRQLTGIDIPKIDSILLAKLKNAKSPLTYSSMYGISVLTEIKEI